MKKLKLIIAIVHDEDRGKIIDEFNVNGLKITTMSSTGGFMRTGNSTLLSGVEDSEVEKAISIIEKNTKTREERVENLTHRFLPVKLKGNNGVHISIGGATIFVTDVERFEKF